MIDYTEGRWEERVWLPPFTLELTAWIQHCYDLLEAGEEKHILADPWYQRADGKPPFTDEQINAIITALDAEYESELGSFPDYHRNRSGCNALPEFHRLSAAGRRALVEGIDRIAEKHKSIVQTAPSTAPGC